MSKLHIPFDQTEGQVNPGWQPSDRYVIVNPQFGGVMHVAVCDDEGTPMYDQILHCEAGGGVGLVVHETDHGTLFGLQKVFRPQVKDEGAFREWREAFPDITPEMIRELGRPSYETPRGFAEHFESAKDSVAIREVEEETGHPVIEVEDRPFVVANTAFDPHLTELKRVRIDPERASGRVPDEAESTLSNIRFYNLDEIYDLRGERLLYDCFTLSALGDYFITHD